MMRPCQGATKPDAGVMVPSPATAPEIMPSTEGLRRTHHSMPAHTSAPEHAARCVAVIAITARGLAESAEPPLKPNQPTHNSPVPITASERSNGEVFSAVALPLTDHPGRHQSADAGGKMHDKAA